MPSPKNPRKAWLLFASVLFSALLVYGFLGFLMTYDPAESATATPSRLVHGTIGIFAIVGIAIVCRAFRRLPRADRLPEHPSRDRLLFAFLLLSTLTVVSFISFLTTLDPKESATAMRWRLISGTVGALAVVGIVLAARAFRRLPRGER